MYKLLRAILFLFPPERAHAITFALLHLATRVPFLLRVVGARPISPGATVHLMGLHFQGPIGLAAGMDKNAEHLKGLAGLGFGHVEVGTVTPLAQPGNDMPRLFRLKEDRALLNRMGFNNQGVAAMTERLRQRPKGLVVGGNIGKNKATPNEQALEDYVLCFKALHSVVDYFVVNVSSPNTPGLRALQEKEPLLGILSALQAEEDRMIAIPGSAPTKRRPLLLKIAPDLTNEQLDDVISVVMQSGIQGIVATNTTVLREDLRAPEKRLQHMGPGGISGAPLRVRSTEVVRYLRQRLPKPFVIIGVGGVDSAAAAIEKLEAGADLVQVYTGLVYEGPALLSSMNEAYAKWKK
jgi:dihydroorotate dehydrogenase